MKTLLANTTLTAVILANAVWMNTAYAVSPTTDEVTHIRIAAHNGKVTKAQVATNLRRIQSAVNPKITHEKDNVYNVRVMSKGSLRRYKTNALAPGLYNLTVTMKNGSQVWIRSKSCKADAIHIAHKPAVKSTRCN